MDSHDTGSVRIRNCYDSHCHWLATGEVKNQVNLRGIDFSKPLTISIEESDFRTHWLMGFGWDENLWQRPIPIHKSLLDTQLGEYPVAFYRVDGHALWVNTLALKQAKITDQTPNPQGGVIVKDEQGQPTGLLIDTAMKLVEQFIPKPTLTETQHNLLTGMRIFNQAGFTHIRDLSCDLNQWHCALELDKADELTIYVDQFFSDETPAGFEDSLKLAQHAKAQSCKRLRPRGVKIYYDGALGSEGALLSQPYASSGNHCGLKIIDERQLSDNIERVWRAGLEIAVHGIGDQASFDIVMAAKRVKEKGIHGLLHLEHAQMLNDKALSIIQEGWVICHFQPCHWLSDHVWFDQKIPNLKHTLFRWADVERCQGRMFFGSDSPIEQPSLLDNQNALLQSQGQGIPPVVRAWYKYHEYPADDACWTQCDASGVKSVYFNAKPLSLVSSSD